MGTHTARWVVIGRSVYGYTHRAMGVHTPRDGGRSRARGRVSRATRGPLSTSLGKPRRATPGRDAASRDGGDAVSGRARGTTRARVGVSDAWSGGWIDASVDVLMADLEVGYREHVSGAAWALYEWLSSTTSEIEDEEDVRNRVYKYYVPVYEEVVARLRSHCARGRKPMVVGVSAPQGCGKTTLTRMIVDMVRSTPRRFIDGVSDGNVTAATVSMDDFYLTAEAQTALAESNPTNAMLQYRGNAGTHELELGTKTLDALAQINDAQSSISLPRYDKLARTGRGDRKPESEWDQVSAPIDVVLLEGWMLGFEPIEDEKARAINPDLVAVNEHLKSYKAALWGTERVAWWIIFKVKDPKWVYDWRLEAERKAGGGLSDEQVKDFVDRFIPAYDAYLPALYENPPPGSLVVVVDKYREVQMVSVVSNEHDT